MNHNSLHVCGRSSDVPGHGNDHGLYSLYVRADRPWTVSTKDRLQMVSTYVYLK